ncbi:MAG: hypothetical protein DRP11_01520 [Candidatus Aenigmatarchaeota archaeon]|nr:MAG: hypothetical protein DRP11_01520 [Candidatus Aenigmarchaeota archaeon]
MRKKKQRQIVLAQAELMLKELGYVDRRALLNTIKAMGIEVPRRTFYRWLSVWGQTKNLREVRGYIPERSA